MELGVDYIDIVLLHCMTEGRTGPPRTRGSMEYLMKAKEEKLIRAHGTSCHGMDPLRTVGQGARSSRSTSPGSTPRG